MQSGIFLFGHDAVGQDPNRIDEFVGILKHNLLFQSEIVLPDRIAVASFNLRRALINKSTSKDMHDIFSSGHVGLAIFQERFNTHTGRYDGGAIRCQNITNSI